MKLALLAFITAGIALAQSTFTLTIPGDPFPPSITISAQAIPSMIAGIEDSPVPGTSPIALTSSVTSGATSIPVSSVAGISGGMGLCFGTVGACTEVMYIHSISGNTLTVARAVLGTTAAAYTANTTATYIRYGEAASWLYSLMQAALNQWMVAFPGPTIATANAAIAVQSATITTTVAGGISAVW
jgi:hypothetical protein